MRVSIQQVSKNFGETPALRDVSLEIEDKELFFLLGPSGCGKTTLLRLIAGFYVPDRGEIHFDQQPMSLVPPYKRNTGMVFQNYALWPHMTVAENVAYGLEVRRVGSAERKARTLEALSIVRMEEYANRTPNQLSGGQQQRVALARALVIKPDVLLLDEPLSNLDAQLRLEMRSEIRRIHDQIRVTTIYVTHDQKEALSLADRLAILRAGRIEQVADPRSAYRHPANPFVADFIGEINWLEAHVASTDGHEPDLRTEFGSFRSGAELRFQLGEKVRLGFRPEAVQIGPSKINVLNTVVRQVTYLGEVEQYDLALKPNLRIKAIEPNPVLVRRVGDPLEVHIRSEDLLVFPQE